MPRFYNKQRDGDIDWCDYTFNPFTGGWGPGGTRDNPNWCPYCYARRIAERFKGSTAFPNGFEPTFYPGRLAAPSPKEPSRIFLGSMGDLCGLWLWRCDDGFKGWYEPGAVQQMVFSYCAENPQHQYIILTKSPSGLDSFLSLPPSVVFGVSVTGGGGVERERLETLRGYQEHDYTPRVVVSYEPALTPLPELWPVEDDTGWLIIGAQTGPGAEPLSPDEAPNRGIAMISMAVNNAQAKGWRVWVKGNVSCQKHLGWYDWESGTRWPQERLSMPEVD